MAIPKPATVNRLMRPALERLGQVRWLQVLLVAGVLLGAAGIGAVSGVVSKRLDPIFLAVVGIVPVAILALNWIVRRWEWMPTLILVAAAFIPFSLPTGTGSRLVDSLLITLAFAGLWLLRMITRDQRFALVPSPLNLPLLLFILSTLWSIGWSTLFRDAVVWVPTTFVIVQTASGMTNIMLVTAFLMVNNFIHDVRMLKVLTGVMLAAAVAGLLVRYDLIPSALHVFVNVEGLFTLWCIAISAALALYCQRWPAVWRLLAAALAVLYVIWGFILHTSWLAGWLPGLVALAVLIWQHSRRAVAVVLVCAAVFAYFNQQEFAKAFAAEDTESGGTRLAAWTQNWRITQDHLLFGTGPAGYAAYYMSYFPTDAMATHSNYIDMLSQNGIVGLIPLLIFFVGLAWTGYRLTRRLRGRGDFVEGLANASFAGCIACIVAMAIGDWLFPFAYTQTIAGYDYAVYSWLFMAVVLVLDRLTRTDAGSSLTPGRDTRALEHV